MATFIYDADNISQLYENKPIQPVFRLKIISYSGQYTGQATHTYYEGLTRCSFDFYENEDVKYVPNQRVKRFYNGITTEGEEIGPYFIMKVNGTGIFNTGISLVSLDSDPFIKIYGLPTNEQHGLVNLMFGGTLLTDPGKVDLMIHNYGRVEQQLNIGDNIAMII